MHWLDLTLPAPAANLACDEALLDAAEAGELTGSGLLRVWEPADRFIVLGYANRWGEEVHVEACRNDGIPILRRCSGGGAVLQGPGCLNYSLLLRLDREPALANVTSANRFIMQRHAEVLSGLLHRPVSVEGVTDLALGGRKFSGNAQRRKRQWMLFHGTFLLESFDLAAVERYLKMPSRQPDYRAGRAHRDFLTALPLSREVVKMALRDCWRAFSSLETVPVDRVQHLLQTRYQREEWNLRW